LQLFENGQHTETHTNSLVKVECNQNFRLAKRSFKPKTAATPTNGQQQPNFSCFLWNQEKKKSSNDQIRRTCSSIKAIARCFYGPRLEYANSVVYFLSGSREFFLPNWILIKGMR